MKHHLRNFCCILLLSISPCVLYASESIAPLVVARGDNDYPPYEMHVDGKLTGLHIELIRGAANLLGREVVFKSQPWKRAIQLVKVGEVDATSYMGRTPERELYTRYLEGNILSASKSGFMILEERKGEIRYSGDLKELTPFIIGVERGFYYSKQFEAAEFLHRQEFDGIDTLLNLLRKLRVDLIVYNQDYYLWGLKQGDQFNGVRFLQPALKEDTVYLGFSRARTGSEKQALQFSDAMIAFKQTSAYQAILTQFGLQ